MRGDDQQQSGMFSYVSLEERVPQDHPLRWIRKSMDEVLRAMAKDFDGMYAKTGRPSVPPERLLRAALLGGLTDKRLPVTGHPVYKSHTPSTEPRIPGCM